MTQRLLSINNYHYARGGAEVVYLEHNRLIQSRGWQVMEFSMNHPDNLASDWSDHFIDEVGFDSQYGPMEKLIKAGKSVYSFEARKKLAGLIATHRPSHAHGHNIYHHLSPSILHELKRQQIPTVLTLHDLKIACPAYKMLNQQGVCEQCKGGKLRRVIANRCMKGSLALSTLVWLEATLHSALRSYSSCVDRFVVPSKFFLEKFVEWGWPREQFAYIPNFIDTAMFTPRYDPGDRFVYFGRLSEEKGIKTFVSAVLASGCKGLVVGSGPIQDELTALVQSEQADIEFVGYQSGDALKQYIAGARAVVIPSEWYENAPMSVLEAAALGKPVIGAAIGGIPELIDVGSTGHTFASGDVEALAGWMRRYESMADSEISDMGRAARERLEQTFSAERYLDSITSLYASLT